MCLCWVSSGDHALLLQTVCLKTGDQQITKAVCFRVRVRNGVTNYELLGQVTNPVMKKQLKAYDTAMFHSIRSFSVHA